MNRFSIRSKHAAWATFVTAAALCLTLAPAAAAQEVAQVRAGSGGLDFLPVVEHGGFVLTVSGPEGFHHRAEFGSGESPGFSIYDHAGGVLPDGVYNYELRMVPNDTQRREAFEANQVATKAGAGLERPVQSGAFSIVAGSVVAGGETEPGQRPEGSGPVLAPKTTILTTADATIIQSLCVGIDCTSSENFGFDTIRLKENNTRIKFEDTSVGTFPSTDWQLTANDSASGGQNKFSIEDVTTPRVPFTIEGGSTTNSIYVDSTGRVGFRTSTPVLDIHVATSNSPGMRLEQTSAGGFTAQTWDIAGNEANFFVRSVTTGSQLPFRIRPGAPTSSIDVAANGNVGIGTASPTAKLDIRGNAAVQGADNPQLVIVDTTDNANDKPGLVLRSPAAASAGDWVFEVDNAGNFQIDFGPSAGAELLITDATTGNGAVTIAGNLTVNGTFSNPSSRTLKQDFEPVDAQDILAKVASLPIVEWTYKSDPDGRRHVGPTAEDFLAAFGLGSDGKYIFPLDVQGVTIAAVQGLHHVVQEKDARIQELEERLAALEELLLHE